MRTNLDGFNVKEATLYTEEDIKPGMAVMIAENYSATIATENNRFMGICTAKRGDYISVALTGALTVPYTGMEPDLGYNPITPDENGYLKFNPNGSVNYLILDINTDEKLMTIWL